MLSRVSRREGCHRNTPTRRKPSRRSFPTVRMIFHAEVGQASRFPCYFHTRSKAPCLLCFSCSDNHDVRSSRGAPKASTRRTLTKSSIVVAVCRALDHFVKWLVDFLPTAGCIMLHVDPSGVDSSTKRLVKPFGTNRYYKRKLSTPYEAVAFAAASLVYARLSIKQDCSDFQTKWRRDNREELSC